MLVLTKLSRTFRPRSLLGPIRTLAVYLFAMLFLGLFGAGLLLLLPIVLSGLFVVFSVAILAISIAVVASAMGLWKAPTDC